MNRPENIEPYKELDLKLGIKSSLPHVKSTLGLSILLWECSSHPHELIYSVSNGDSICIPDELAQWVSDELSEICSEEQIDTDHLISTIESNQLYKSQIEALMVAFELIWKIAKVEFIRGNCDKDKNIAKEDKIIDVYNIRIYLVHDISKVSIDLKEENIDIVVYGHSHKSNIYEDKGIIYINPGSVGPRRFNLPISMAKLKILDNERYYDSLKLIDKNIYRYKCYEVEFIPIVI